MLLGFVIIPQGKGTIPSVVTFKSRLDNALIHILCGLFCIVMGVDEEDYKVFFTSNFSSSEKQKNIIHLMEFRTGTVLRNTKHQFILGCVLTGANSFTILGS